MANEEETPIQTLAREVTELKNDLAGTDRAVSTHNDRISRLENTVARADDLLIALDRITKLEKTVRALTGIANSQEDKIPQFGAPWEIDKSDPDFSLPVGRGVPYFEGDPQPETVEIGPELRAGHEYRIRSRVPMTAGDILTREGVERKAYNRGYVEGQNSMLEPKSEIERKAIQAAEDRVKAYMTGHFSEATIRGVVQAIRGVEEPRSRPIRDNPQG